MSHRTRIAVAGFGLIGRRHAEIIRSLPELELAAIVEPGAEPRRAAEALGVPCFESLAALFQDGPVDGVILATPTPLHLEQALACIERDCPVLVEKPIAVTAGDGLVLTRAAAARGVPVLVGHHRRHNGVVQAAKAALEGGAIGAVRAVQATCWFYKPDHYFEAAPWRTRKGAGPISVNLVHDVDLLRHFCGEVATVQAALTPARRGFENEDLAAAILTFRSGAIATLSVSDAIAAPWSWELTARENPAYPASGQSCYLIGGETGSLSIPDLRIWSHGPVPDWWRPISATSLLAKFGDPLVAQARHFAAVIHGREQPLVPAIEGLRSLQIVEAVERAATGRRLVEIEALGEADATLRPSSSVWRSVRGPD